MILEDIEQGIILKLSELKKTPHNTDGVFNQVVSFQGDMEDAVKKLLSTAGCIVMYTGGDMDAVNLNSGRYLHEAGYLLLLGVTAYAGVQAAGEGKSGIPGVKDMLIAVVEKLSNQKLALDITGIEFMGIQVRGLKQNRMVFGLNLRTVCLMEVQ